ncbi:MAG TPA: glycosyltransferase [Candidatus Rubrimentiphilum sp.]|nr:glycosyltransferase [Candidatus Rubrimentiphilum sp.]
MRVALVHDYLNQRGGAERVFAHIARAYPDAPIYTALHDPHATADLVDPKRVRVSYLNAIPGANRYFRYLAPFYPRAFERFDFSDFDTIVSSTTAWTKGIRVPPGAVHICYVNTVSRFAFAYDEYVGRSSFVARPVVRRLIEWDKRAAQLPTRLIANSRNVADRIERYYGRESTVLHCPVDLERFSAGTGEGNYFLVASRLLPYKRIELAIRAAAIANVALVVVGTGPDERRLRALAAESPWVRMAGYVDDAEMNRLLGNARAAIVPGEEDFGLVPLEAAATGRPAIAFRAGGALETIVEGQTGEFFDEPSAQALAEAMQNFDPARYDPRTLRAHAEKFSPERFVERLRAIVDETRSSR